MVQLFLSEPNWDGPGNSDSAKSILSLLNQLDSHIWELMISGSRSEARLWLCDAISGMTCISFHQQRDIFLKLLTCEPKRQHIRSQLLQMFFEKRPHRAGSVLAKRGYLLEKFFQGNPHRIMQWFSDFGDSPGLEHKKGAKSLSQFAFIHRDVCWEELEWKGKHGQSPATVATKPHYFLDLDVQKTVKNFLENVPEFWSSKEFTESIKDGEILFIDTKFFVEHFADLLYSKDAKDVWAAISEFLEEESFSALCHHLLITLHESDLRFLLELLQKYIKAGFERKNFGNSTCWIEFILFKSGEFESFDQLLLLNAVINKRRQLFRLVHDEECQEENVMIKNIVSQICETSKDANTFASILKECFKFKTTEVMKLLGLHSWVVFFKLSEYCQNLEFWETLFKSNGIRFCRSDKYALIQHDGSLEENESKLDELPSARYRKKRKAKKKRRNYEYDDNYCDKLLSSDTSDCMYGLQSKTGSWLLSTDDFSTSWTNADLPEYLSSYCFSAWMKYFVAMGSQAV